MVEYHVDFEIRALKALKKLDKSTANMIWSWVNKNLEGTDNPRRLGKALKGEFKRAWRYRIGDYRLICDIQDKKVLILVLEIGNRKDIYKER
ncbi:type II toxin-antitoxin system RelE/ParE family toxin [Eubacteriales bacterium OttesenSCG-928-A19]|nr:type II toxin-antitoxin system RelE/ParE family toxin [Eubacteriales bacterium OttesenSCG-928-A19]